MKKTLIRLLIMSLIVSSLAWAPATAAPGQEDPLNLDLRAAILLDAESGQVLYEMNADSPIPPASLTKIMTLLIVMEAIKDGRLKWDDIVTASTKAHKMTGSVIFLADGERATVEQLVETVAIYSANDSAVALAEHIAVTEESFVDLMNDKARDLGLKNTRFLNVTGLPYLDQYPNFNDIDGHMMSARDIAIVSRELVNEYPEILDFTSRTFATFQNGVEMPTRNLLMLKNDWIDGLKTGQTDEAKYCLSATGKKDGMRLIAVTLGAENEEVRMDTTLKLLNYGFDNFEKQTLVKGKENMGTVKVERGKEFGVDLIAAKNLEIIVDTKRDPEDYIQVMEINQTITAPFEANTVLGQLYYELDGEQIGETINIVAKDGVEKGGFFRLLFRGIKNTFFDIFEGIADKLLTVVGISGDKDNKGPKPKVDSGDKEDKKNENSKTDKVQAEADPEIDPETGNADQEKVDE